jgi:glutathione S-transferase
MTLRLHHAPMACSLASRLALMESSLPYEVVLVHTNRGEQKSDAYRRINPRGKVPALETAEGVITESTAILPHIADLAPGKALLPPPGSFERAEAQAWLSYLSSTVHAAYGGLLRPDFEPVRDACRAQLVAALETIDAHLEGRDYLLERFSVCDLYLLVFSLWRAIAGPLPALPNLDAFQMRVLARPGIGPTIGEEMRLRAEAA